MITYLSTASGIQDSLGHSISTRNPGELLSWLMDSATTTHPRSSLRAFWDLDSSTQLILSLLPAEVRASIAKTNRATWSHYRLFYIPGKMFAINKSHDEVTFYDLSQYFPDDPEPTSIQQVQQKADLLLQTLSDLGILSPTNLTSPVAIAEASGLLKKYQSSTIPTIFDAPEPYWEAYEYALQCTPREWVSNYQIGAWLE